MRGKCEGMKDKIMMRVLVVCSNRDYLSNGVATFIEEQMNAVCDVGVECVYFCTHKKGLLGYLQELPQLRTAINNYKPNVIHAHYGLCGLLANLATRTIPVITTYHGSDINNKKNYRFSKFSIWLSRWNIFVSHKIIEIAGVVEKKNVSLIPCGIDDTLFHPIDKLECRKELGMDLQAKYVLFPKKFDVVVKDYPLAQKTVELLNTKYQGNKKITLLEFDGYTRAQSVKLMNAIDALLLTSKAEGSPQVIKEAMACGCPIVSVDVGDVKERITGVDGCFLAKSRNPEELAELLEMALAYKDKTDAPTALKNQNLSNSQVAQQIVEIYNQILYKTKV